ncbi:MAG TPA: HD domain-containing protein [Candidatus Aphodovivens avicola]|nr:HD domain-containing protein [Candidatus Aphodovivens avicola]
MSTSSHSSGDARSRYAAASPALPVPPQARRVIEVLEAAGFEAWCVGGFVRDSLLGRPVSDIDIACSALWPQTEETCLAAGMRVHRTGEKHGTVTVVCDDAAFEVTTFRVDGAYSDARHPDEVRFVRSLKEDLARRDFTINAMAYHPLRGLTDPFGGLEDARRGIIRTVGDPAQRFGEDALRILRACRFSSQLGFSLDGATYQAMLEGKRGLLRVSSERITAELQKLLLGDNVRDALLQTVGVISAVLPELVAMKGFDQCTPYHCHDVLEHTARAVAGTPPYPLVRWAALFHDMGKPAAFFKEPGGRGHFYGHAKISVPLARGIMDRLTFSTAFRDRVLLLVERHDDVFDATPRAVKRALARMGGDVELFRALCDLKRGDASAQAPAYAEERMRRADDLLRVLDGILAEGEAFTLKHLAVNGRDAMDAGIAQGPSVGAALAAALDAVIDEQIPNDRETLLAFLDEWRRAHS